MCVIAQKVMFSIFLTLSMRVQEDYGSWVCVCVSVCLSVKLYLTSGASVRHKNTVTYSVRPENTVMYGQWRLKDL